MSDLHLVSFDICPYVQRAMILLLEKNAEFRISYIDLQNKPEWFLKISPLGKVPVLEVDGHVLFESAAICEYIDETQGQVLHPSDPLVKAQHRAWMEYSSVLLGLNYQMATAPDEAQYLKARDELKQRLATLEANVKGPYFTGEKFALVDAFFAPVFRAYQTFAQWGDTSLLASYPKLGRWATALLQRPSVQKAVPQDYGIKYENFVKAKNGYYPRTFLST